MKLLKSQHLKPECVRPCGAPESGRKTVPRASHAASQRRTLSGRKDRAKAMRRSPRRRQTSRTPEGGRLMKATAATQEKAESTDAA